MRQFSKLAAVLSVVLLSAAAVQMQKQRVPPESESVKRAGLLLGKGDVAGAIAIYDEAIKLSPAQAEIYVKRGVAFRLHGSLDKAIQDFDRAVALNPLAVRNDRAVAEAYNNHGQIQLHRLRPEDAIVDFDKALNIYPTNPRPYLDRGEARILVEDFTRAIQDFNTYLTKEKRDSFSRSLALAGRSLAQHFLGRDDEAKKDLEAISNLSPDLKRMVMMHVGELEAQLMILRHLRSQEKRAIVALRASRIHRSSAARSQPASFAPAS